MILSGQISEKAQSFTWEEVIYSKKAHSMGYSNIPTDEAVVNLQRLCEDYLQPLHDEFGELTLRSCYRSPSVNRAVGGGPRSLHIKGLAADLLCEDIFEACRMMLFLGQKTPEGAPLFPYDELLLSREGKWLWVHLGISQADAEPKMRASMST